MENNNKKNNDKKRKKGILAIIWESMTKTGGCCGSGESCGCASDKTKMDNKDEQKNEQSK